MRAGMINCESNLPGLINQIFPSGSSASQSCIIIFIIASSCFSEFVLGVHVRTFGHKGQFKRRSLFIMNHISHFDWMYFWLLMVRQGDLSALSTVTKDMMGKIPIFGTCVCVCVCPAVSSWHQN